MPDITTIDGPAGSGKSSAAKRLAARIGGICLDSGSFYRIVASELIRLGLTESIEDVDTVMSCVRGIEIKAEAGTACQIGDRIVSYDELKSAAVDAIVSAVSRHEPLRAFVNDQLRRYAAEAGCPIVCEGRDAGHVIFPDADYKVYLDAPVPLRAKRIDRTEDETKARDLSDMTTKGSGNLMAVRQARQAGYYVVDGGRPMEEVDAELYAIASGLIDND